VSNVHPAAAVGFDRAAAAYERGRASYPAAAIEAILRAAGAARGRTLLELGAGTGKLTRELVASSARVIALEPVAGMREVLAQTAPGAEPLDTHEDTQGRDDVALPYVTELFTTRRTP
jgi:cyclopropane fatty-acyl-phospholipid synthase-like methyltransferase